MALVKIKDDKSSNRITNFWEEIMRLRNLFKFEFFYTNKPKFSSEIEAELLRFDQNWRAVVADPKGDISAMFKKQDLFVSRAILLSYLEADKVVCHTLNSWDIDDDFNDDEFIDLAMFKGKELHWQSKITRLDSVSKPFLVNALRYAKNANLIPVDRTLDYEGLERWKNQLDDLSERLFYLKQIENLQDKKVLKVLSTEHIVVPDSGNDEVNHEETIEEGPHITAFFDMDRTLINDFSAKNS
jgi:putative phosphoserine phosphatase/1-acylglycerol-3-phosphate O-acyltransferase